MGSAPEELDVNMSLAPESCRNAEQYALLRLKDEGEPMTAVDIAEDYECTNTHMRRALNKLRDSGDVKRVQRGVYALKSGESDSENPDMGGFPEPESSSTSADGDGGDVGSSSDRDGFTEESGDAMPTHQELQKQRKKAKKNSQKIEKESGGEENGGGQPSLPLPPISIKWVVVGGLVLLVVLIYLDQKSRSERRQQNQREYRELREEEKENRRGIIPT